jgi:hypothetical protein
VEVDDNLVSEMIAKERLPYEKHWRTLYKELDVPSKRLN